MTNKRLIILILLALILVSCRPKDNGVTPQNPTGDKVEDEIEDIVEVDPIEEMIDGLTLEEKIGQLLIVGKDGYELNDNDKYQIENNKVGGFIFFSRNIDTEEQVLNMLNDIKDFNSKNKIPLFLSIDEEGGIVSRLAKFYNKLPSAKKLGDKNNVEISNEYGKILGLRLKSLGFNLDFAPVLDINSNPNNPVIGSRAFGSTYDIVVNNGLAVLNGINSENIISSVKHFPGHGDTSMDSHIDLPRVDKSYKELEDLELIPFKEAIKADADMIMVAHILYPQLDEEFPATLSKVILNDILREELGYRGVVISDDLTMGAIVNNYTLEDAALSFIKNGGDIALVCHGNDNPSLVIEKIKESIDKGEISIEDIDEKVYRILSLKEKYNLEDKIIETINTFDLDERTIDLINKINS